MNSGSSALISAHGHSAVTTSAASWYQTSRTGSMFDRRARAAHDHDMIDAADFRDRGVDIGLERNLASAAQAFVGGDDEIGFAILDAAGNRVRREAAEDHRMDRADARAGEHRIRGFRDHRHIDGDAVALLHDAVAHDVGEAADLVVQFLIGDVLAIFRIVAFPDDRGLVGALRQVAVDAVIGGVERAVLEPLDRDVARLVGGVLHLGEGLHPADALGLLAPERVGVLDRGRVHLLVLGVVDERAALPLSRNVVNLVSDIVTPPAHSAPGSQETMCRAPWGRLCEIGPTMGKAGPLPLWSL